MKFRLLGTGTSSGVPVIGCPCPVCTSDNPKNTRLRCSAYLQHNNTSLLIDCGPDFRQQALRNDIQKIDAVLVTHEHADHINGLDELRTFNFITKQAVPVYAQQKTLEIIKERYAYCFNPTQKGGGVPQFDLRQAEPLTPLGFEEIEVFPVPYKHGIIDVLGYRFGGPNGLAYLTDCSEMPDTSLEKVKDCRVIVLDALRPKPHPTHFNIDQAVELAEKTNAEHVYFIHLTCDVDHDEWNAKLPDGIQLGYDNQLIELDV
jgi:phosphoribosyl 1,2-cyclic phosphate phosphodiesterase